MKRENVIDDIINERMGKYELVEEPFDVTRAADEVGYWLDLIESMEEATKGLQKAVNVWTSAEPSNDPDAIKGVFNKAKANKTGYVDMNLERILYKIKTYEPEMFTRAEI